MSTPCDILYVNLIQIFSVAMLLIWRFGSSLVDTFKVLLHSELKMMLSYSSRPLAIMEKGIFLAAILDV